MAHQKILGISLLFVFLLAGLPSCRKKEKIQKQVEPKKELRESKKDAKREAGKRGITSYFDEAIDEFLLEDNAPAEAITDYQQAPAFDFKGEGLHPETDEIFWEEEVPADQFKPIYFDFNGRVIRPDQQEALSYDVELIKKMPQKEIRIEGFACHSAGSRTYNLAISNDRAQQITEELQKYNIKCVAIGRGTEMPVVRGGSREEQWPNRRVEIYARAV